jgi:Flp pilus assembly CpaE family ATPase
VTGPCSDVAVFAAESIYLVANPDVASVRNAHRLVDRIGQLGATKDRIRIVLNRMSDQHEIGPKQIESTLGFGIFAVFPSDYSTVSAALNSGVPLTLSNHTELAAQFAAFTRQVVFPNQSGTGSAQQARAPFMGLF